MRPIQIPFSGLSAFVLTLAAVGCGGSESDPPPPPGAFMLVSPAQNELNVSTRPELQWEHSGGAATYTLWLRADDDDFEDRNRLRVNQPWTTSHAITSDLDPDTIYYWRVVAHNAGGDTQCGEGFSFTTMIVIPPVMTSGGSGWGFVDVPYAYQIPATHLPTSYGVTGSLPTGLSVDTTTGLISGTPTEAGEFGVTLSATNAAGTDTAAFTLTITAPLSPYISIDLNTGERTEHAVVPVDLLADAKWKTTHMVFKLIPSGSYLMGDQVGGGNGDERPVHPVNITRHFYMGVFPVTQRQWAEVMDDDWPSHFTTNPDKRPVEQVTWDNINDSSTGFMDRANALGLLGNMTLRLPSEAEWEYACKAGTSTRYSYGDTADGDYMWHVFNSDAETKEVGTKLPNPWGLYDMHGNVFEWTEDWLGTGYYQHCLDEAIVDDPPGPATGTSRSIRGGAYFLTDFYARSAQRMGRDPHEYLDSLGLRVAIEVR